MHSWPYPLLGRLGPAAVDMYALADTFKFSSACFNRLSPSECSSPGSQPQMAGHHQHHNQSPTQVGPPSRQSLTPPSDSGSSSSAEWSSHSSRVSPFQDQTSSGHLSHEQTGTFPNANLILQTVRQPFT